MITRFLKRNRILLSKTAFNNHFISHVSPNLRDSEAGQIGQGSKVGFSPLFAVDAGQDLKIQATRKASPPVGQKRLWGQKRIRLVAQLVIIGPVSGKNNVLANQKFATWGHSCRKIAQYKGRLNIGPIMYNMPKKIYCGIFCAVFFEKVLFLKAQAL